MPQIVWVRYKRHIDSYILVMGSEFSKGHFLKNCQKRKGANKLFKNVNIKYDWRLRSL